MFDNEFYLNEICFKETETNFGADIEVKLPYPTGDGNNYLTYSQRLELAIEEIKDDMHTYKDFNSLFMYYKNNVQEGNIHYWGEWIYIPAYLYDDAKTIDDRIIYFGVRMD